LAASSRGARPIRSNPPRSRRFARRSRLPEGGPAKRRAKIGRSFLQLGFTQSEGRGFPGSPKSGTVREVDGMVEGTSWMDSKGSLEAGGRQSASTSRTSEKDFYGSARFAGSRRTRLQAGGHLCQPPPGDGRGSRSPGGPAFPVTAAVRRNRRNCSAWVRGLHRARGRIIQATGGETTPAPPSRPGARKATCRSRGCPDSAQKRSAGTRGPPFLDGLGFASPWMVRRDPKECSAWSDCSGSSRDWPGPAQSRGVAGSSQDATKIARERRRRPDFAGRSALGREGAGGPAIDGKK